MLLFLSSGFYPGQECVLHLDEPDQQKSSDFHYVQQRCKSS